MATVNYKTCHRRCFIKLRQRPSPGHWHLQGPTHLWLSSFEELWSHCPRCSRARLPLSGWGLALLSFPSLGVFFLSPSELLFLPTILSQLQSFSIESNLVRLTLNFVLIQITNIHSFIPFSANISPVPPMWQLQCCRTAHRDAPSHRAYSLELKDWTNQHISAKKATMEWI